MTFESLVHLNLTCRGEVSRRQFLELSGAAFAGSAFLSALSAHAQELKKEGRACIMLWLAGAPSQLETWDPKPGTANGGPTKAIGTAIPGVQIAEHWPKLARSLKDVAILRALTGKEAAHERGTYHLHTGRRLGGPTTYPNFGSVVAYKLGDPRSDIPNFVSIGQTLSSGYLGVQVAPFIVQRAGQLPDNVAATIPAPRLDQRLALLGEQEQDFAQAGAAGLVSEHRTLYEKATKLMRSPRLKAFQLDDEPANVKDAYGANAFGQGVLVARRLVDAGVPFVEVRSGGWDMHNNLFDRIGPACAQIDQALSQLLADLKKSGRLQRTLVVCLGEFGRTPKINNRTPKPGRDHWARNFNVLLAGAGIRGGSVVGKTSGDGQEIVDGQVFVEDLFQTMCRAMTIDPAEELYTPEGRPLRIVDGGQPIPGLLG